jgi:hypothetical protein
MLNSQFADEMKNQNIADAYKKFRLVIQAYNDHEKALVLTQALTIQRISQRIILALAASNDHHLYLRDITQAYMQLSISLN